MDDRFNEWLKDNSLKQNAGMREAWTAAVAAEREWIHACRKLPKNEEWVVVWNEYGCEVAFRDGNSWWTHGERYDFDVVYWHPLPDPPESEAIRARGGE